MSALVTAAADIDPQAPNAHRFEPLPANRQGAWNKFLSWEERYFPNVVGLLLEEVRVDYGRLRLPYRPELRQPAGFVHGGAIATLIDTVVVPAVASAYDERPGMLTLHLGIEYLGAVKESDMIAEGWVTKRGRRTVFCTAEVRSADGEIAAVGTAIYSVKPVTQRP